MVRVIGVFRMVLVRQQHHSYLAFSISGIPGGEPIWFMATRIPKAFIEEVMAAVGMSLYLEVLGGPGGSKWW